MRGKLSTKGPFTCENRAVVARRMPDWRCASQVGRCDIKRMSEILQAMIGGLETRALNVRFPQCSQ